VDAALLCLESGNAADFRHLRLQPRKVRHARLHQQLLLRRSAHDSRRIAAAADWGVRAIAFVALVFGTLNVIGGFLVTDRMLGMFKSKKKELPPAEQTKELTK
jgi:hypothetical protein